MFFPHPLGRVLREGPLVTVAIMLGGANLLLPGVMLSDGVHMNQAAW